MGLFVSIYLILGTITLLVCGQAERVKTNSEHVLRDWCYAVLIVLIWPVTLMYSCRDRKTDQRND